MTFKPQRFRERSAVVEAVHLTAAADWDAIAEWCGGRNNGSNIAVPRHGSYVHAYPGEWVVRSDDERWTAPFAVYDDEAFGHNKFMGADLLPLGARGMGETVPNRFHPVDPEWLDDIRPRLAETIARAAAVVRAHRDGTVCPREQAMLNGTAEITRKCLRPAGHVEDHSDTFVTWNEAGEKTS